jgi:type III restriction enzyme
MPLPKNFPTSPHEILEPSVRWYPGTENLLADGRYAHLPPLVQKIREEIYEWRKSGYSGCSQTSLALLKWWFLEEHIMYDADGSAYQFQYYYAQREALETVIYLYEVKQARDKYSLLRYDASGAISTGMFDEDWTRYVVKMATGAGKTKVMSLVLAWSYFHRIYESESKLSKNFLVIAPNIIVLDRIRSDFDGLKIFFTDPVLPDNGYMGRYWRDDFQPTLHIQDEVGVVSGTGNIFLTNIHRVYDADTVASSFEDENTMNYFLGKKPVGKTNESKIDLGDIVRSVDELMVINDEAHHVHDSDLAWFGSIRDIANELRMK